MSYFLKGRSSVTQRKRSEAKLTTREDKERGVRLRSVIAESSLPDLSDGQTGLHRCFDVPNLSLCRNINANTHIH